MYYRALHPVNYRKVSMSLPLSSCRNRRVEVFISIKPSSSAHHEHGGKDVWSSCPLSSFREKSAPSPNNSSQGQSISFRPNGERTTTIHYYGHDDAEAVNCRRYSWLIELWIPRFWLIGIESGGVAARAVSRDEEAGSEITKRVREEISRETTMR